MREAQQPSDYKAIALWGEQLGSYPYYIKGEQRKAFDDKAPIDAIYFNSTLKRWYYVRDLSPGHHFHNLYKEVA